MLTAAVVAAYYMNPEVCREVGYTGQRAIPFDPDAPDYLDLLDSVKGAGRGVSSDPLTFRFADPDGRYAAVRLCRDLHARPRDFARDGDDWVLELDTPLARLEYQLELEHADGTTETVLDPGNPQRAPGAFGEKSVLLTPGYEPPAWLEADAVEGASTSSRPRPRARRGRSRCGLEPGDARTAAAAAGRPRRPGVRRARRA